MQNTDYNNTKNNKIDPFNSLVFWDCFGSGTCADTDIFNESYCLKMPKKGVIKKQ